MFSKLFLAFEEKPVPPPHPVARSGRTSSGNMQDQAQYSACRAGGGLACGNGWKAFTSARRHGTGEVVPFGVRTADVAR